MDDPSVKAYLIQNDPLDSSSGAISDESWMDTPLNNGIREITVSIKNYIRRVLYQTVNA